MEPPLGKSLISFLQDSLLFLHLILRNEHVLELVADLDPCLELADYLKVKPPSAKATKSSWPSLAKGWNHRPFTAVRVRFASKWEIS